MEVNNESMIPNLSKCTNLESEPTTGPAANAVAALELNVYDGMAGMENRMNARLQTIETKINTNTAEIHRIATVINQIQASLTALTGVVQAMSASMNARGG